MKFISQTRLIAMSLLTVSLCLSGAAAMAADMPAKASTPPASAKEAPPAPPSKEMREKMATIHDKAAACLRSDKSMDDCHQEMMSACHDAGEHTCSMMEKHHKMMKQEGTAPHDHTMQPEAKPAKP